MNYLARRPVLLLGLLTGAVGIGLLRAGGVHFPVAVPPGIVILVIGAVLVAAVRRPWTAWVGCALGLFVAIGFVVSGVAGDGFDHLLGRDGVIVAAGQITELAGVLLAAVSGAALATRRP